MTIESEWLKVAEVSDLEPNTGYESDAEIDGEPVAVFQLGNDYFALGPCPHEHGPLSQGIIENGSVRCPWHSAEFDIRTGACAAGPSACRTDGNVLDGVMVEVEMLPNCAAYEVKVEDGAIFVRRPVREGAA